MRFLSGRVLFELTKGVNYAILCSQWFLDHSLNRHPMIEEVMSIWTIVDVPYEVLRHPSSLIDNGSRSTGKPPNRAAFFFINMAIPINYWEKALFLVVYPDGWASPAAKWSCKSGTFWEGRLDPIVYWSDDFSGVFSQGPKTMVNSLWVLLLCYHVE